jgi:multidrug efflux system membrane fusion protein
MTEDPAMTTRTSTVVRAPRFCHHARVATVGLSLALLSACGQREATVTAPEPTPVRIAAVTAGPVVPPIVTTGTIAARDEQRLSFKVGGVLQQVTVREGDEVRRGQLLARLDQTEVAAQVAQAQQLADKAARDLARGEALHADQVIPLEQLQNLRTQAEVARAQVQAVRFNEQNAVITAPGDGVVLRRLVEERELAAPGQVVLLLGRRDSGHVVRLAVADRQVVRIRRGDPVTLRLDAWPEEDFTATVTQIGSAADAATGLFQIEAQLQATDRPLVSGMVARVRLAPGNDTATLPYVPIGAVLEGDGERASVFIADGAVARRRAVRVAFIAGDEVAIREGLAVGDQVVTAGAPYLDDGDAIAVVP